MSEVFADVTHYNTGNTRLIAQDSGIEMENVRDFMSGSGQIQLQGNDPANDLLSNKQISYPHPLKAFLQDFSIYDEQFNIPNEFNQLNLLDDMCHVKRLARAINDDPDMNR